MITVTVTLRDGERLVRVSENLFDFIGTRTADGKRLSYEWGEPDAEGCYTPTITEVDDGMAVVPAADRASMTVLPDGKVVVGVPEHLTPEAVEMVRRGVDEFLAGAHQVAVFGFPVNVVDLR